MVEAIVGPSPVTVGPLTRASVRASSMYSFNTYLWGRGGERPNESDMLPALALGRREALAGGGSGEPGVCGLGGRARDLNNSWESVRPVSSSTGSKI